jgi:hypothetical protein
MSEPSFVLTVLSPQGVYIRKLSNSGPASTRLGGLKKGEKVVVTNPTVTGDETWYQLSTGFWVCASKGLDKFAQVEPVGEAVGDRTARLDVIDRLITYLAVMRTEIEKGS